MSKTIPTTLGICLVSYTALNGYARANTAVSPEAKTVSEIATVIVNSVESSQSLFGDKSAAISRLRELANQCVEQDWDGNGAEPVNAVALSTAENFLRVLPENLPLPEFAIEPDGSISLDWIQTRNCVFSLSVGTNNRLAFAWLDGADKGHAVSRFDGDRVPKRILEGITDIVNHGDTAIWLA